MVEPRTFAPSWTSIVLGAGRICVAPNKEEGRRVRPRTSRRLRMFIFMERGSVEWERSIASFVIQK